MTAFYSPTRCCLLLWLLLLLSSRAWAQPAVACDLIPQCSQGFDEARRRLQAGPSEEVVQMFQKLFLDYPDRRLLYWIARLLHLLGRPAEAVPRYQQFLASGVERDPQLLAKARGQMAEAQASLEPTVPQPTETTPEVRSRAPSLPPPGVSPMQAKPGKDADRPVYKRAWLWGVIGGVAAIGIAVGVIAGLTSHSSPPSNTRDLGWSVTN